MKISNPQTVVLNTQAGPKTVTYGLGADNKLYYWNYIFGSWTLHSKQADEERDARIQQAAIPKAKKQSKNRSR